MNPGLIAVSVIAAYLALLLGLGLLSNRFFRGTSADYFLASRRIGSFLLVMSLFGTTMTAFALVGSSGEAFKAGIGVYGKMASWAGIGMLRPVTMPNTLCLGVVILTSSPIWRAGPRPGVPCGSGPSSSIMTCEPETLTTRPTLTSRTSIRGAPGF